MDTLTGKELKKMILLSYQRVEEEKEEINKINVFPVPDQDTGTNLSKTLFGIKEAIEDKEFSNLKDLSDAILDGALTMAQGNAGIIYTGFLAGFLPALGDDNSITAKELSFSFQKGLERAISSIQEPKEGTILDVIEATSKSIEMDAEKEKDIVVLFKNATEKAREALIATQEKMDVLKKANVVDAGGLGFLIILESYLEAIDQKQDSPRELPQKEEKASEKVKRFIQTVNNRFEIVVLIFNPKFSTEEIKAKLKGFGDSIDIIQIGDKVKVHIHTDLTEEVKDILRNIGKIENMRVEDMIREAAGEKSIKEISIGIVVDEFVDLTPKIKKRYGIEVAGKNDDLEQILKAQLKKFKRILVVTSSSRVSSNYQTAMDIRSRLENPLNVYVLDSLNISSGESLLVLKMIEFIKEQRDIRDMIAKLHREIHNIHTYIFLPNLKDQFQRRERARWIKRVQKNKNIRIIRTGFRFGTFDIAGAIFKSIDSDSKKLGRNGKKIRVVITHTGDEEEVERLGKFLKEIKAEVSFINRMSSDLEDELDSGSIIASWS